jgi:hypothetical protein
MAPSGWAIVSTSRIRAPYFTRLSQDCFYCKFNRPTLAGGVNFKQTKNTMNDVEYCADATIFFNNGEQEDNKHCGLAYCVSDGWTGRI